MKKMVGTQTVLHVIVGTMKWLFHWLRLVGILRYDYDQ